MGAAVLPLPINSKIFEVPPCYSTLKRARRSYRTHKAPAASEAVMLYYGIDLASIRFGRLRSGRLILNRIFSSGLFKIRRPPQTRTNSFRRRRVALRESWIKLVQHSQIKSIAQRPQCLKFIFILAEITGTSWPNKITLFTIYHLPRPKTIPAKSLAMTSAVHGRKRHLSRALFSLSLS